MKIPVSFQSRATGRGVLVVFLLLVVAVAMVYGFAFIPSLNCRLLRKVEVLDLWFLDSGELAVLGQDGSRVNLTMWDFANDQSPAKEPRAVVIPGQSIPGASFSLSRGFPAGADFRSTLIAVSEDASLLAWIDGEFLAIQPIKGSGGIERSQLQYKDSVARLAFLGNKHVLVVHGSGIVKVVALRSGDNPSFWLSGTLYFNGPGEIWPHGSCMGYSNFRVADDGDVGCVHVREHNVHQFSPTSILKIVEGTAASVSRNGKLAVGTNNGEVILFPEEGERYGGDLEEVGRISALVALDNGSAFAADRNSIHYVSRDGVLRSTTKSIPDISLMDYRENSFMTGHLAFSAQNALGLCLVDWYPWLSPTTWIVIAVVSLVVGFLGLFPRRRHQQ